MLQFLESLDPRTIATTAALAGFVLSLAFWATLRDEDPLPGTKFWLLTAVLAASSLATRALEDFVSDTVSRAAANAMIVSAMFFLWHGARVFYRRNTASIAWPLLATAYGVVTNVLFVAVVPSASARVGFTSVVLALGAALAVRELLLVPRKQRSAGVALATGALLFLVIALVIRAGLSIFGVAESATLDPNLINNGSYLLGAALFLCTLTGLLIVVNATRASQVRALAYVDQLTGALSRRGFYSATALLESREFTRGHVFVFDVNEFKRINDSKGHETGDNILRVLASSIRQFLPPKSLLARFGGDEFVVYVRDIESPSTLADDVRAAFSARSTSVLAQSTILHASQAPLTSASVSVGWAPCARLDEASFAVALHEADREMYHVKVRLRQLSPR